MRLKEDICALATGFLHADTIVESYILRSSYRMTNHNIALLIPVENQVRELDAKILLACIAARRGLQAIIGLKRDVESRIASFQRSIYLSKSLLHGHRKFIRIARKLGHEIAAWDEDALVHLPPDIYFSRRLSPVTLGYVSHLFAWGPDNADLWRQYPELPEGLQIHITGNPRGDLLRPEIRKFYQRKVEELKRAHGDFILINTNFNHVNAFTPNRNLFQPADKNDEQPKFGRAARGMTREYAEGLHDHKKAIFEHFQNMIPILEKAFPDNIIIVRPHQVEDQNVYHRIAARCERVRVTNQGYVVPWIMAAKVLIHNGCTTSVEAAALNVPAISFRAIQNDYYDFGFYRLPNMLSHQCLNIEELQNVLKEILSGKRGVADGDERDMIIDRHLTAQKGPLACERIIDVIEKTMRSLSKSSRPPLRDLMGGWYKATKRRLRHHQRLKGKGSQQSLKYQHHKNPGITPLEVNARIERFQQIMGNEEKLRVNRIYDRLYHISA